MKFNPRKVFLALGVFTLLFGISGVVLAVMAAQDAESSSYKSFFKICSTQLPAECTIFTWQDLFGFIAASILASVVLLFLANKKQGGCPGA